MRQAKWIGLLVIFALFVLSFAGTPASYAQQQQRYTIRLLFGTDFWSLPAVAGVELGFFGDEGLDVSIQRLPYGHLGLQAVVAGSADLAITANTRVVNAVLQKFPIRAIANSGVGYNARLVVPVRDTTTQDISQLVGKRFGLQVGTGTHAVFVNYLTARGLSMDDFQVVDLRNVDIPAALQRGDIDFALIWEPAAAQAVHAGIARVILDAADIASSFHMPVVTSTRVIQEKPEALRRWARAWVRTMRWLHEHPEEAEALLHDFLFLGGIEVDRDVLHEAMKTVRFDHVLITEEDIDIILQTAEAYVRMGQLAGLPEDFEAYVDNSFIEQALREVN